MNDLIEIMAPCHFGLEAPLKREIYNLGYEITKVEDGRVTFLGDLEAVCYANIHLRIAERILIKIGQFEAKTFDELFEGIYALNWEDYIPKDGKFWVTKATSVKSKLFSPSDIQSIAKKAIVKRLGKVYNISWFTEEKASYPIRIYIMKDMVTVGLDTSGASLHKRGYRRLANEAPLSETLAAGLISLTPWRDDRILIDPFCGSGTILIEAAMMAAHIAPGLYRSFTAESWDNLYNSDVWSDIRQESRCEIDTDIETNLRGYDIDKNVIRIAMHNAKIVGVDKLIHFQERDVAKLSHSKKYGFIITNPPYGERLMSPDEAARLYRTLGDSYKRLDDWSMYIITALDEAERYIGLRADKNRKIYNGMIKTYYYQYIGKKPPKKKG